MNSIKKNRLYDEFADLWPLVSAPEDYKIEAAYWRDALHAKLGPGKHEFLELGVGGGNNLSHLTGDFQATAVDISEKMLAVSRALNPDVTHHVGDMRDIRLNRKFNAVIIHDSISYMTSEEDLLATFNTAKAHLEKDGVLLVAPDWYIETFNGPEVSHNVRKNSNIELTFIEYLHDPDPSDSTIEGVFFYLMKDGKNLRIEQDLHIFGLFTLQTWTNLLNKAGFRVEKWPHPVHSDQKRAYLLVGILENGKNI